MFKLNRMTDYAIVVLGAFARRQGEILATAQLSELTGLNQSTVAKVAKTLLAADLLNTQRGVHGGYRLSRKAAISSLVQIVEAIKSHIAVNDCVDWEDNPSMARNHYLMSQNWSRVSQVVKDALNYVSLEDLIFPAQLVAPADQEQVMDHRAPSAQQIEMLS